MFVRLSQCANRRSQSRTSASVGRSGRLYGLTGYIRNLDGGYDFFTTANTPASADLLLKDLEKPDSEGDLGLPTVRAKMADMG